MDNLFDKSDIESLGWDYVTEKDYNATTFYTKHNVKLEVDPLDSTLIRINNKRNVPIKKVSGLTELFEYCDKLTLLDDE